MAKVGILLIQNTMLEVVLYNIVLERSNSISIGKCEVFIEYHQDMRMCLYGKQKADIERKGTWLQQDSIQSNKQG